MHKAQELSRMAFLNAKRKADIDVQQVRHKRTNARVLTTRKKSSQSPQMFTCASYKKSPYRSSSHAIVDKGSNSTSTKKVKNQKEMESILGTQY